VKCSDHPVRQDSIGVFVIFDGIESIDSSVIDYLSILENEKINIKETEHAFNALNDYRRVSGISEE
jgi:hypothetical protein